MNEHSFTKAVISKLPKDVHVQSMTFAALSANGTPDRYIDFNSDLWVEFKYAQTQGRNGYNVGADEKGMLSAKQKEWLARRYAKGENCLVVVGVPSDRARGFILTSPAEWEAVVPPEVFIPRLAYAGELAAHILRRVS